ncbi:endonuclease III [Candidatus Bathyarchaeota archaeon]|nr:MAG: endonuclease III [Candidatus Bathyarchaeota archaeon]
MTRSKEERMRAILDLMEERYGKEDASNQGLNDPFRTLIGCVLSHRTRDENSSRAAQNLFEDVEGPGDILRMAPEELKTRIRCSGFYNQKARNIRAICETLVEEHGGIVPRDRDALIDLHGVGPKTADIVLSHAFASPAIAVDVHVATVARRLGLVESDAGPERVKEVLEGLVSPAEYRFVDNAFVRHGKEFCRTRNPRCSECFISSFCDYYQQISRGS